jgi:hypothetical protein
MLELHTYIYGLLVIAATGMYFIFHVLIRQIRLFKIRESREINNFRRKLFALSLVIIIMGIIPIGINIFTLFHNTGRPSHVPLISIVYSGGVHLQSLFLSYILWRVYRLSDDNERDIRDLETKHLNEKK